MKSLLLTTVLMLAVPVDAQEKPFEWKLQPVVGSRWRVDSFARTKIAEHLPGVSPSTGTFSSSATPYNLVITITVKVAGDYDVVARDANGIYTIRFTYRNYALTTESVLDGRRQRKSDEAFNRAFIGSSLLFKLDQRGLIPHIVGLEELRQKQKTANQSTENAPPSRPNGQEYFMNLAGSLGLIPTSAIFPGKAYSYPVNLPPIPLISNQIYVTRTFKSRQEGKVNFEENGLFQLEVPQILNLLSLKLNSTFKVNGKLGGNTIVDEASGLIVESNRTARYLSQSTILLPDDKSPSTWPTWFSLDNRIVFKPRP